MQTQHQLIDVLDKFIGAAVTGKIFSLVRSDPVARRLNIKGGRWQRFHGPWPTQSSYFDKDADDFKFEKWDVSLRIRYVNQQRSCTTTEKDPTSGLRCANPTGLHVFRPSEDIMPADLCARLNALYTPDKEGVLRDGDSNIIFYSHMAGRHSQSFEFTYVMLQQLDAGLASMVHAYAKAIQTVLGATDADLDAASMSIVKYAVGSGIRQHIDNITDPMGTIGPLISVALGDGKKYLDLMPTLADNQSLNPVRVQVEKGDVIVMDGDSRLEYSHSVPYGHKTEMFSLLFKFREIRNIPSSRVNTQLGVEIYYTIDPSTGAIPTAGSTG